MKKWLPCQRVQAGPTKYLVLSPGDSDDDDENGNHGAKKYEVQLLPAPAGLLNFNALSENEDEEDDVIV